MTANDIGRLAGQHGLERLADAIAGSVLPAIHLSKGAADAVGASRLGGLPDVAAGFAWPRWKNRPLGFVGQIRCGEMAAVGTQDLLPRTGLLYFFYDVVDEPWGFDPKDRGAGVVLYSAEGTSLSRATAPETRGFEVLRPVPVRPRVVPSIPAIRSSALWAMEMADDEARRYIDFYDALDLELVGDAPKHQMLGHSHNIQGDMQLECQLVTHGLYCGDDVAWKSARGAELAPGAAEWRLLFQMDSDDDVGVMWGDCGLLYYWIRESDLRTRTFGQAWTILQCS